MPHCDDHACTCTGTVWRIGLLALAAGFLVAGVEIGLRMMKETGESCPHCDERTAEAYLFKAYPRWRREHTAPCPASADELSPYLGLTDARAGMGDTLELTCDASHVVVHLRGPDRLANTDDDFWRTFP